MSPSPPFPPVYEWRSIDHVACVENIKEVAIAAIQRNFNVWTQKNYVWGVLSVGTPYSNWRIFFSGILKFMSWYLTP